MVFEKHGLRVVVPLDPAKGAQYIEPVCDDYDDEEIDHIYMLTMRDEEWIKPIADG